LKGKDDPNRCSIVVTGSELVELKRHAHKIPECPGLDRRIQRYYGQGRLKLSRDELDWLVAVLDAVLHNPKGYPCVQYDPFAVEYVPTTDARCVACQRLYDSLNQESERLAEISTREWLKLKKRAEERERQKAERDRSDQAMSSIQAVFKERRCPAIPVRVNRGYTIHLGGRAVSRIRQRGKWWEVLWWSHRNKWDSIGDMGGVLFDTAAEAADYVVKDPMGIFWR
jgi:hypothetical protein